jgi:hypothetical protein
MSDRTDSIHSLQRAARSQGRREASMRVQEPRPSRGWTFSAGAGVGSAARRGALAARDAAHYHALRAAELFGDLPQRTRRIAAGAGGATVLLVVVLTATAGADSDTQSSGTRAAKHRPRPPLLLPGHAAPGRTRRSSAPRAPIASTDARATTSCWQVRAATC